MSSLPPHLSRYQAILDDFDGFAARLEQPLPQTLAVNPLRTTTEDLLALLQDDFQLEPVCWRPGALRLGTQDRPGRSWTFAAGLFTLQEEASLLPAQMLDVRPGHRVLDLCAAPGNKTTHLALALQNRGTVVANELKRQRLTALHEICRRLGLMNVSTCAYDGLQFPSIDAGFDRILVDAPCSAEGKAQRGYRRSSDDGFRRYINGQQRGLLQRALDLCEPGGRILYSTCTFAPEENEAIVSELLEQVGDVLRVVPTDCGVPGASPGLTTFMEQRFHPDLKHAVRLWPHRTGTGGFFAVLLERSGSIAVDSQACRAAAPAPADGPGHPLPATDPRLTAALAPFEIDLPDDPGVQLIETTRHLKIVCRDHAPPANLRYESRGLELARLRAGRARLSNAGALALGRQARTQCVELDLAQLERWRRRQTQTLRSCQAERLNPGLVLVRHQGLPLGTGLLRQDRTSSPVLESQAPKAWAPPEQTSDRPS